MTTDTRTSAQRLDDATELQHLQMRRAALAVRRRITDPQECAELLDCLGLSEA